MHRVECVNNRGRQSHTFLSRELFKSTTSTEICSLDKSSRLEKSGTAKVARAVKQKYQKSNVNFKTDTHRLTP